MRLCKAFASNSSANIKLSKTQMHKIGQSGGFSGELLGPLLNNGLSLAKSVSIPLELTVAAAAAADADAATHEKNVWIW